MRHNYQIKVDKETGTPYAQIANHDMWELVEYLSGQRTAVSYSYCQDYFVVRFLHLDETAAQALLDEWAGAEEFEYTSSTPLITPHA